MGTVFNNSMKRWELSTIVEHHKKIVIWKIGCIALLETLLHTFILAYHITSAYFVQPA